LAATLGDPLRRAILTSLTIGPASAAELAAELEVPPEKVRYQIKRLRAKGMIEVHEEHTRRGAIERTFIADSRMLAFDKTEALAIPREKLRSFDLIALQAMFKEALEATRAGTLHASKQSIVVRVPLRLDDQGFKEIGEAFETALSSLFKVREESLARLERSGKSPQAATSGFLFFERENGQRHDRG
jgi:DNA-binding transcriptional ArsR family regulator